MGVEDCAQIMRTVCRETSIGFYFPAKQWEDSETRSKIHQDVSPHDIAANKTIIFLAHDTAHLILNCRDHAQLHCYYGPQL